MCFEPPKRDSSVHRSIDYSESNEESKMYIPDELKKQINPYSNMYGQKVSRNQQFSDRKHSYEGSGSKSELLLNFKNFEVGVFGGKGVGQISRKSSR